MIKALSIVLILTGTILMFISIVSSCNPEEEKREAQQHEPPKRLEENSKYSNLNYDIYTLDGCEYIVVGLGCNRWGSHKGDCKSPIHIKNEEVHTAN